MEGEGDSVEKFFGEHAAEYSKSPSHAQGADLSALIEALSPKPDGEALDVATGTGFTAVALARRTRQVTGIDATEEMLEEAREFARKEGVRNVQFELGDALGLRFADSSFDLVTARRAAHHFADVPRFLLQARRVLKPAGLLGVVDMSPPAGAEVFANQIEKMRDSSHRRAFSVEEWRSMVSEAGFDLVSLKVLDETVSFEGWLYPVATGGEAERSVRGAWRSSSEEVRGLMRASFEGPEVSGWTKSRVVLAASKTP